MSICQQSLCQDRSLPGVCGTLESVPRASLFKYLESCRIQWTNEKSPNISLPIIIPRDLQPGPWPDTFYPSPDTFYYFILWPSCGYFETNKVVHFTGDEDAKNDINSVSFCIFRVINVSRCTSRDGKIEISPSIPMATKPQRWQTSNETDRPGVGCW